MEEQVLLPHLFRTEYRKMVSVLCHLFGIEHIEVAEDIVSETFLIATETWSIKGLPDNPVAWLYTVAKNKTRNYLKRTALFEQKLLPEIRYRTSEAEEMELVFSGRNIADSQLAMIFAVCHPAIPFESQVALALNLLCGFGAQEIADAFLTNKEVIYKRINRAKHKLKEEKIRIEHPLAAEVNGRLDTVLTTVYLLFSEGYYASSQNTVLRRELCEEAMRLIELLILNPDTNTPAVHALLALMCFHCSRFDARTGEHGEMILYADQDESRWDWSLVKKGTVHLNRAASGSVLTKYHLEAGIAYWHTLKADSLEKWGHILGLYNELLILEYSPIAALNRTFALAKVRGARIAIAEAEKLGLTDNHFYHSLLGNLYSGLDDGKALQHFEIAFDLANSPGDKGAISKNIRRLKAAGQTGGAGK